MVYQHQGDTKQARLATLHRTLHASFDNQIIVACIQLKATDQWRMLQKKRKTNDEETSAEEDSEEEDLDKLEEQDSESFVGDMNAPRHLAKMIHHV